MIHAASQTWTLARLLPLMIGYCVPENDDYWKHFTMLLEILRYVLAPEILHDEVVECLDRGLSIRVCSALPASFSNT